MRHHLLSSLAALVVLALARPALRAQTIPTEELGARRYEMTLESVGTAPDGEIVQIGRGQAVLRNGLLVTSDRISTVNKTSIQLGSHRFAISKSTKVCSADGRALKLEALALGEPVTATSRTDGSEAMSIRRGLVLVPMTTWNPSGLGRRDNAIYYDCVPNPPGTRQQAAPLPSTASERHPHSSVGKEYRVRHILVATEQEAADLIASLSSGADFSHLAKKHSKDPGSAEAGGDLGFTKLGTFVPDFENAMVSLSPGETSKKPVRTQFGYHVIRLEETRN